MAELSERPRPQQSECFNSISEWSSSTSPSGRPCYSFPEIRPVHRRPLRGQQPQKRLLRPPLSERPRKFKIRVRKFGLFVINSSEANNPKNDNYCLNSLAFLQQPLGYTFQKKCLRFALRRNEVRKVNMAIINPFKVAGFESKERLRSSEIKECQRGDHQPLQSRCFESKEWLCSSEIKEDGLCFVLRRNEERQRGDNQPLQSRWFWEQRTAM